jgi:hypothetical protein
MLEIKVKEQESKYREEENVLYYVFLAYNYIRIRVLYIGTLGDNNTNAIMDIHYILFITSRLPVLRTVLTDHQAI